MITFTRENGISKQALVQHYFGLGGWNFHFLYIVMIPES